MDANARKTSFLSCFLQQKIEAYPGPNLPFYDRARISLINQCFLFYLGFTLDINTTVSTWLERLMLIAIFMPQSLLLLVISPRGHLYLQEQVQAKIPENRSISVNRSRVIFGFFTVLGVLHLGIGQRDFGNRDLFLR